MSRHIADRAKTRDSAVRMREFLRLDRNEKPNAASVALQKRPRASGGEKLRQFARIDRGHTA